MFYIQQHKSVYEVCEYLRPFIEDCEYNYGEDTLLCEIASEYLRSYVFCDDGSTKYDYIISFDENVDNAIMDILEDFNHEYVDISRNMAVIDIIVLNVYGFVAYITNDIL